MPSHGFHGRVAEVVSGDRIRALQVSHPADQVIARHRHGWACLTLFVCGSYVEELEAGEVEIAGPAAVLYPPGHPHANRIGRRGLETVSLEFELGRMRRDEAAPDDEPRVWVGGGIGRAAGQLARALTVLPYAEVEGALRRFLRCALAPRPTVQRPVWLTEAVAGAAAGEPTTELARRLDLHPAWLARRYLMLTGESLQQTLRRRRVERALHLIRTKPMGLAAVAAEAGFCDQSHMNRSFREMLGRTPRAVRQSSPDLHGWPA
jgi:AraC family transcriptional regulator